MKKYLTCFMHLIFILTCQISEGQNLAISYQNPSLINVCESGFFEITLQNGTRDVNNVRIEVQLPAGMQYLQGSVQGATEIPNGLDIQNPVFTHPAITQGNSLNILFEARSDCRAVNAINSGFLFTNKVVVSYDGGMDQLETFPYRLETPLVLIESVAPTVLSGNEGDVLIRTIKVKNTRLGRIASLNFRDNHEGGLTISTDLQNPNQGNNFYSATIGPDEFSTVGNGDGYLDQDESYEFEERLLLNPCSGLAQSNSTLMVSWGCSGPTCGIDSFPATVNITPLDKNPELEFEVLSNLPPDLCTFKPFVQEMRIKNVGNDSTSNIFIALLAGQSPIFGFDTTNLNAYFHGRLVKPNYSTGTIQSLQDCPDFPTLFQRVNLNLPITLQPGDFVDLSWNMYVCPATCDQSAPQWNFEYQYPLTCPASQFISGIGSGPAGTFPFYIRDSITYYIGRPLEDNQLYDFTYQVTSANLLDTSGFLEVALELPCGMSWAGDPFELDGKNPISIEETPGANSTSVTLLFDLPFSKDSIAANFRLRFNCRDSCFDPTSPNLTSYTSSCQSPGSICVGGTCTGPVIIMDGVTYFAGILDKLEIKSSSAILPESMEPGCGLSDCDQFELYFQCEVASLEFDKIRGYVEVMGDFQRTNFGWKDNNDDRRADDPMEPADPGQIRLDRVIPGDTTLTRTWGVVTVDSVGATFSKASFKVLFSGFDSDDGREGGITGFEFRNQGLFTLEGFESLDASVRVVDVSSGKTFQALLDPFVVMEDQTGKLVVINTRPEDILDQWQFLYFEYQFDPGLLSGFGIPPAFVLEEGDSLFFEARHRVLFNPLKGDPVIANLRNTGLISIYDQYNSAEWAFHCGLSETPFQLSGYRYSFNLNSFSIPPCEAEDRFTGSGFSMQLGMPNFFTGEVRHLLEIRDWKFSFPGVVQHEESYLNQWSLQGGIPLFANWYLDNLGSTSPLAISFDDFHNPLTDEGFFIDLGHKFFGADCQLTDALPTEISTTLYFLHQFPDEDRIKDTIIRNRNGLTIERPVLSLYSPNPDIVSTNHLAQWNITFSNFSNFDATHFWLEIDPGTSNFYDFLLIDRRNEDTLNLTGFLFQKLLLESRGFLNYRLVARNGGCGGKESLIIRYGWNCAPYQAGEMACETKQLVLSATTPPAELEMDIFSPDTALQLCDTVPFHTLEIFNANINTAINLELEASLPFGLQLLPGSVEFSYPAGSPFQAAPDPVAMQNGLLKWVIADFISEIDQNGLPGFRAAPNNTLLLRFKGLTDCGFVANSPIIFKISGKNQGCPNALNVLRKPGGLLNIRGLSPDYAGNFFLGGDQKTHIQCGEDLPLDILLRNDGVTGAKDSLFITLPPGASYQAGSYRPVQNAPAGGPSIYQRGTQQILKWKLPEGVPGQALISFTILIENIGSLSCSQSSILLQSIQTKEAICTTTGQLCDAKIATSEFTVSISIDHPEINLDNLDASFEEYSGGQIQLTGTLTNTGISSGNLMVDFYLDRDGNQILSAADTLLTTFSLGPVLQGESIELNVAFDLSAFQICDLLLVIDRSKNCLCEDVVRHWSGASIRYQNQVLCSDAVVVLGPPEQLDHSYVWSGDTQLLSCTTCSQTTFGFSNTGFQPATFSFTLLEQFDQCEITHLLGAIVQPRPRILNLSDTFCVGSIIRLGTVDAETYFWNGPGISDPSQPTPQIVLDNSSTFSVQLRDTAGCTGRDSVFFLAVPFPLAEILSDSIFCLGQPIRLEAFQQSGYQYQWMPAGNFSNPQTPNPQFLSDTAVQVTLEVSVAPGCVSKDSISIEVFENPVLMVNNTLTACIGESISLLVTGADAYTWVPNPGLSCLDCPNPVFNPTENDTLYVTGFNGGVCADTAAIQVDIAGEVERNQGMQYFCPGDTIFWGTFPVTFPGIYCDTLIGLSSGCDSIVCLDARFTPARTDEIQTICEGETVEIFDEMQTAPGTYCKTFQATGGCDSTHCIELLVDPLPDIISENFEFLVQEDSSITLFLPEGFDRYQWSPSDGVDCDTCRVVTITPTDTLYIGTVFNAQGCSISSRYSLKTVPACSAKNLTIPNVFTPNGDQKNDLFGLLPFEGFEQINGLQIFNRWGEKIYEGYGSQANWDGMVDGKAAPSDVYIYMMEIGCGTQIEILHGDVTLLR